MPTYLHSTFDALPDAALIRLNQIVGPAFKSTDDQAEKERKASMPLVPVSRSTWWRMVKAGNAPKPIKVSQSVTAWRVGDLRTWLAGGGA